MLRLVDLHDALNSLSAQNNEDGTNKEQCGVKSIPVDNTDRKLHIDEEMDTEDEQESSSSTTPTADRSSTPRPANAKTTSITESSGRRSTNFSTKASNAKPLIYSSNSSSSNSNKTQELLLVSIQMGSTISV